MDFNIDLTKMPWPDEADHVVGSGDKIWSLLAYPTPAKQWDLYALSYLEAAEQLYATWQQDRNCLDRLIFPTVFLYRHYVELRLKELIQSAAILLEAPADFPGSHDLVQLWNRLHPLLKEISPDESESDFRNSTRMIGELSALDRLSFAFRYPVDKTGNSTTT